MMRSPTSPWGKTSGSELTGTTSRESFSFRLRSCGMCGWTKNREDPDAWFAHASTPRPGAGRHHWNGLAVPDPASHGTGAQKGGHPEVHSPRRPEGARPHLDHSLHHTQPWLYGLRCALCPG